MIRSLSWLYAAIRRALASIRDASAAVLGARTLDPLRRRVQFLAVSAVLFVSGLLLPPAYALGVVAVALWLLLSTCLAWGANERQRGRIAKKIDDTRPDSLPDLRVLALFTGVAMLCFLPLLLEKAQDCFHLFRQSERRGWPTWMWFLLDKTYLRAFPDAVELGVIRLKQLHSRDIDYFSGWHGYPGRGLVLLAYTLVYLVLLQAVVRLWQIHRDVVEGIDGVANDPDMAVRLGRRAVRPLLKKWKQPDLPSTTRAHILTALGRIGDLAALKVLRETAISHADADVRQAALIALADLNAPNTVEVLERVLLEKSETVSARAAAAIALGRLSCPEAAAPLLTKLAEVHQMDRRYREGANVRKEVVRALGHHLGRRRANGENVAELIDRAVRDILADEKNSSLLEDEYLRVRNKAAGALAQLGDMRAVVPLVERLGDGQYQNPKLIQDTALALGRLMQTLRDDGQVVEAPVRDRVLAELSRQLQTSPNDSVRQAAARALGLCEARELQEELLIKFKAALKAGQEELAQALKDGLCAIDPGQEEALTELEKRTGRLWSQRRRQVLLDGERELAERLKMAAELGEYGDERGLKALEITVNNPDTPEELRTACAEAMQKIRVEAEQKSLP